MSAPRPALVREAELLHRLALALGSSEQLHEVARLGVLAVEEALPGRGATLLLWGHPAPNGGIEAHAGLAPEAGRSAIAAAARAISEMKLGRIDEGTTANIGRISGGTSGNVVAGHCQLVGEVRSIDRERVTGEIAAMSDAMVWAASESGCEVDIVTTRHFTGYHVDEQSASLRLAESALRERGHEPVRVTTGGGSDANVFQERGMDCLLLANGTFDNHTANESVPRRNLGEMLAICEEIVRLAGGDS